MEVNNKRIAINTIIIYLRMIITTIIGIYTTRIVLGSLGVSDFGLYNVVGGVIVMLNVISVAMNSTTIRYLNREQGDPNGNLNKIFNLCLDLHILGAVFLLLLAESGGILYINYLLNVPPSKVSDAMFVFQVSTLTALVGVINIPYQSLLQSFEKFDQVAHIDILTVLLKLFFVFFLKGWQGNPLRFYALGMAMITFVSVFVYTFLCPKQWRSIVKVRFYRDWNKLKEIFVFNNYVAIGAASYLGRSQGSTLIVNYFFSTAINGAMSIAYQVENYLIMFVTNIGRAASPQIFQSYSTDINQSIKLTAQVTKYSSALMILIVFPVFVSIEWLLELWLGNVPEGAVLFCKWTLVSALLRSLSEGLTTLVQANGKIKYFQIVGGGLELLCLPIAIVAFLLGAPSETMIIIYAVFTFLFLGARLFMMQRILKMNILPFIKSVYIPISEVLVGCVLFVFILKKFQQINGGIPLLGAVEVGIVAFGLLIWLCFTKNERITLKEKMMAKFNLLSK